MPQARAEPILSPTLWMTATMARHKIQSPSTLITQTPILSFSGSLAATIQGSVRDYQQGIISQSGVFSWADADGDPIDYVTVGGQALAPSGETVIDSAYGVLVVGTNGGPSASWTYTMKPGMDELGLDDVESFGIMVADIYGGNSSRSLDITLKPLTHAPECEDVFVQWETMPNGKPVSFMEGQLEFSDADFNYGPETLHLSVNGTPVTERVCRLSVSMAS